MPFDPDYVESSANYPDDTMELFFPDDEEESVEASENYPDDAMELFFPDDL